VAGGFYVVHTAYGSIGDTPVGGIEIIGYDAETKRFHTHFFDSQGNISNQDLTFHDGTWTWSDLHTRATGILSEDGQTMPQAPRMVRRRRELAPVDERHTAEDRLARPARWPAPIRQSCRVRIEPEYR
jgi:Protein of unknown function (DUF1579)